MRTEAIPAAKIRAIPTLEIGSAARYPDFALGDNLNIRSGHISSFKIRSGVPLVEVTQQLTQGMSGGPVLDTDDMVVGVIHKGGPDKGRDLAVHMDVLTAWLAE